MATAVCLSGLDRKWRAARLKGTFDANQTSSYARNRGFGGIIAASERHPTTQCETACKGKRAKQPTGARKALVERAFSSSRTMFRRVHYSNRMLTPLAPFSNRLK
jgi:hypothetical protein